MYKANVKCCTSVGFSPCLSEHPPDKVGIVMTCAVARGTPPRYAYLGFAFKRLPHAAERSASRKLLFGEHRHDEGLCSV